MKIADGLENVVAGLGTDRDKRSYSGYGIPRILQQRELDNIYRTSWLAKKIVNVPADDMTREWLTCTADDENYKVQIEDFEKNLKVKSQVNQAIRNARLYGGGLLILGMNEDYATPLEQVKKDSLKFIHCVDRWRVSFDGKLTTDLDSCNFGMPEVYLLSDTGIRIHHTRVIRFDGQILPHNAFLQNGYWHDSELQHIIESLLNYDTVTASIATMIFESNVDVIKSPDLVQLLSTKQGETNAIKRFQLATMMKSFNRTLLLDSAEEYEKKSNSFANLDSIVKQFQVDVAGAADIPITRLFGTSPGGLNATGASDIRNYYDSIAAKQEACLRSQIDRLYNVITMSALGFIPDGFRFDFNPLWQMSELDKATIQKTNADRDAIYLSNGVISEGVIAQNLLETDVYKNMTDEDVTLAAELSKPLKETLQENEDAN